MRCTRCRVEMISSQHKEYEQLGDIVIYKLVSIRECPECSLEIIAIVPYIYQQERLE